MRIEHLQFKNGVFPAISNWRCQKELIHCQPPDLYAVLAAAHSFTTLAAKDLMRIRSL